MQILIFPSIPNIPRFSSTCQLDNLYYISISCWYCYFYNDQLLLLLLYRSAVDIAVLLAVCRSAVDIVVLLAVCQSAVDIVVLLPVYWTAVDIVVLSQALIGYGKKEDPQWLCGGSLISERFVLSAAHCTQPSKYVLTTQHSGFFWMSKSEDFTFQKQSFLSAKP